MTEYIEREKLAEKWRARFADYKTRAHTPCGDKVLVDELMLYAATVAKACLDELVSAPAADVAPVVRWIPAAEKMPPEGQEVLCWCEFFRFGSYNRMFRTYGIGYQYNGMWGGEVAQGRDAKVLAWMPLPEPPKKARRR